MNHLYTSFNNNYSNIQNLVQRLIHDHSYEIISDVLEFEPRNNKPFTFSNESKKGNDYLHIHPEGFYAIKNFETDEYFTAIQAYMFKHQLSFLDAVRELAKKFLPDESIYSESSRREIKDRLAQAKKPGKTKKAEIELTFKEQPDNYDKEFWREYGISQELLIKFNVHAVKTIHILKENRVIDINSSPDNPVYAYTLSDDCYKIYQPKQPPGRKFMWKGKKPPHYKDVQGLDQLPEFCDTIIISEGYKDALSVIANREVFSSDIWAVSKDNAQADLDLNIVRHLKTKCKRLILGLDNDKTGIEAAKKHSKEHELSYIILPDSFPGKDWSDLMKDFNANPFNYKTGFFKNLLQNAIPAETKSFEELADLEKVYLRREELRERSKQKIIFSRPLIAWEDKGIIYPNNVILIQGKSGVHKSRYVEMLCSALLTNDLSRTYLNYRQTLLTMGTYNVLYVDTERNLKEQFPFAIQQIKLKAGFRIDSSPPNFDYISLLDVRRKNRFAILKQYLEECRKKFKGHLVVILDVITDCITSFNSVEESLELIDMINMMINRQNVTFMCVIHENPGGEKARGHLGTELNNKASLTVQISKVNNTDKAIYAINYQKNRNAIPLPSFNFKCEEIDGVKELVMVEPEELEKAKNSEKAPKGTVKEHLGVLLKKPLNKRELLDYLAEHMGASKNTIQRSLDKIEEGDPIVVDGERYFLCIDKTNREHYYSLQQIKPNQ